MNALCKLSLGVPGHVIKILHAKNGQKVDEFKTNITQLFNQCIFHSSETNALPLPNSHTRSHKTIKFGMLAVHQIF